MSKQTRLNESIEVGVSCFSQAFTTFRRAPDNTYELVTFRYSI